jgi:hypothetical protein
MSWHASRDCGPLPLTYHFRAEFITFHLMAYDDTMIIWAGYGALVRMWSWSLVELGTRHTLTTLS